MSDEDNIAKLIKGKFDQLINHRNDLLEGMIARYMLTHGCALKDITLVEERKDDCITWRIEPAKKPVAPERQGWPTPDEALREAKEYTIRMHMMASEQGCAIDAWLYCYAWLGASFDQALNKVQEALNLGMECRHIAEAAEQERDALAEKLKIAEANADRLFRTFQESDAERVEWQEMYHAMAAKYASRYLKEVKLGPGRTFIWYYPPGKHFPEILEWKHTRRNENGREQQGTTRTSDTSEPESNRHCAGDCKKKGVD